MGAKLVFIWNTLQWWEQSMFVLFAVWISLELLSDTWKCPTWLSRFWQRRG